MKKRFEFKNKTEMQGWLNTSGASHLESMDDSFIKPIKWGLFKWNTEAHYPTEKAISIHSKEVNHDNLVCRPVAFQ